MRKAKSNFSRDKINDATNYSNPKETWKLINCLLGRTNRSTYVTELLADDDTVISDPYLMSELFNDYFINIGQKAGFRERSGASSVANTHELYGTRDSPSAS